MDASYHMSKEKVLHHINWNPLSEFCDCGMSRKEMVEQNQDPIESKKSFMEKAYGSDYYSDRNLESWQENRELRYIDPNEDDDGYYPDEPS